MDLLKNIHSSIEIYNLILRHGLKIGSGENHKKVDKALTSNKPIVPDDVSENMVTTNHCGTKEATKLP